MSQNPGDERALLHAVCAEPGDDVPRLAYADYLDENGQADRAEFIRVQVELARLPGHDPRRLGLGLREAALLRQHGGSGTRTCRPGRGGGASTGGGSSTRCA
jgi:uncharacterized protein (TIGR02996 family)